MNAQAKFASRFTEPADPREIMRILQGMAGQGPLADVLPDGGDADDDAEELDEAAPPAAEEPKAPAAAAPKSGRESNGTFAKGNPGGPGNPFNRQVARLRQQLIDSMTPAVFQQAIAALVIKACSGEMAALKLLFQYTLGKPAEAVHPDRVALDEAELVRDCNNAGRQWRELLGAPILETLMKYFRFFQMLTTEKWENRFAAGATAVADAQEEQKKRTEARRARAEARRAQKVAEKAASAAAAEAATGPAEADPDNRAAQDPAESREQPAHETPSLIGGNGPTHDAAAHVEIPDGPTGPADRGKTNAPPSANGSVRPVPDSPAPDSPAPAAIPRVRDTAIAAPPSAVEVAHSPAGEQSANPDQLPTVADRGKTKAPPLTNGTDRRVGPPPKSVPEVRRTRHTSKRNPRAA